MRTLLSRANCQCAAASFSLTCFCQFEVLHGFSSLIVRALFFLRSAFFVCDSAIALPRRLFFPPQGPGLFEQGPCAESDQCDGDSSQGSERYGQSPPVRALPLFAKPRHVG